MPGATPTGYPLRTRRRFAAVAAACSLFAATPFAAVAQEAQAVPPAVADDAAAQRVTLVALTEELKFDQDAFTVTAGLPVVLTLENPSDMPHNAVFCLPGAPGEAVNMTVAMEVWSLPDALEREYVPPSDKVLFHTRLVNPGESDTIRFEAPKEPGDYVYVCTVPGHAMTMWGTMHVVPPGEPAGGHDHGSHAPAAPPAVEKHPYLTHVSYQYVEGEFKKVPDFAGLAPSLAGMIDAGRLDLPKTPRKDHFAVLLKATLEVPEDGRYVFALRSDDGAWMRVGGESAVKHDGLHTASLRVGRPLQLTKGPHVVELGYFNGPSDALLQVAWSGPGLHEMEPLSSDMEGVDLGRFFLKVGGEPVVQRGLMPDASPRSIAVGLPGGTHYCFDTEECFVPYGWTGHFLDVGPQHGYGDGRGGQTLAVLGDRFTVGAGETPLRIGDADTVPEVAFLGYERTAAGPKMLYTVDGVKVAQTTGGVDGERGLRLAFEFESTPPGPVFFVVGAEAAEGLELSSSAGEWAERQLQLPPDAARSFTVTIIDRTP